MKGNQRAALSQDEQVQGSTIQELPTGSGKTAKGYANLLALRAFYGEGTYFYITSNKPLVDQTKFLYNEFHVIYGRNEYDCLYYEEPRFKADQIACSLLTDCPFRVDSQTGNTLQPGVEPCPYLHAKWKAKQSKLIVCTMAFYLFTTLYSDQWGEIKGVVVDEVDQLPDVIRKALSYEITEFHLEGIIKFLQTSNIEGGEYFQAFLDYMKKTVKRHGVNNPLLDEVEIASFIDLLGKIDRSALKAEIRRVLRLKQVSEEQREVLKKLEMVIYDLHRYTAAFEYSLETDKRKALNYTYGYLKANHSDQQKESYSLHVKCYHVAPIIRKIFPADRTFFQSATIGNIDAFRMETGLQHPFFSHQSEFPVENTRIYLPTDVENLSATYASNRSKVRTLRKIVRTCKLFAGHGHRCLVLVVSDEERQQFIRMAKEENVQVITYGDGLKAKEAMVQFKKGDGDLLLGTFAQYGQGIDLPGQIAPVTFALRPGYPPPNDPQAMYEERRFKKMKWVIWMAREMRRIIQARGRNVRNETDKGVTFCMSMQYRQIVLKSLPAWLLPAYQNTKTMEQCVADALKLLEIK